MIRQAQACELEKIIALWKQCFPGDEQFTEWFFAAQYDPSVTLVDEEDGVLCAMLQMLPYQLRDQRGVRPVTYIYGACTAPQFRRQHRMDRLLQHSFALDIQAGHAASILIPQEEWLFGFYQQFGYETAFYTQTQNFSVDPKSSVPVRRLTREDIPAMRRLYEQSTDVLLMRSDKAWQTQFDLFDTLGAGVYGLERDGVLCAYAFVWHDGAEKLWAQELLGFEQQALSNGILQQLHCTSMKVTTCGTQQKLGCIRYHDDTLTENGYFNLLFN